MNTKNELHFVNTNVLTKPNKAHKGMMCPKCGSAMHEEGNMWKCNNCGHTMPREDGDGGEVAPPPEKE